MAVKTTATGWAAMFEQMREPTSFLQSMFTVKPGTIYNGEGIDIEIIRHGETIATVVKRCTGPNYNDIDISETKEISDLPSYEESFPIAICDLVNRTAGVDPYQDAKNPYVAKLFAKVARAFAKGDAMVMRGVELQASQILQTGTLSLTDRDGNVRYTLDFQPKATHFPTSSVGWDDPASDKLGDLESLAEVIRKDGKVNPDRLIFGSNAINRFIDDEKVQKRLDNRRMELGLIDPMMMESGATYQGEVKIGSYVYEMWTYPEFYQENIEAELKPYIDPDNVVMLSSKTRLDRASARVPILNADQRFAQLGLGRMSSSEGNYDITPNIYSSVDGKAVFCEVNSRTLLYPAQIDGYGCLTTVP